ncbi:MAG: trypsin-like peptidase domain-containing protein [Planctomycetota bacterium]
MRIPCVLLLLSLASRALASPEIEEFKNSVIQVFTVSQEEDYFLPWQRPDPQSSGGSAFFIGHSRLMTNAHVVSDARNLLVKRPDRADRKEARVLFVGHDCDLAVLTVDDPSFFEGMKPLPFGPQPALRSTVAAVGYPMGGRKLSITEGVVSRIEVRGYSHSGADEHLTIQIDAAINPGNSGGPVLQEGKVVGVAFQGQFFAQNIGYMIPPSVIHHFLADIADDRYDGYPELGVIHAELENDALRAYLDVPGDGTGVVVLKPLPYSSAAGVVRRNDVLHAIDGVPIRNDGTILVEGEALDFAYVVEGKQVGESVKLSVRREGKVSDIDVPLKAWKPPMTLATIYDRPAQYLAAGGYVFVPLTSNYLFRAGRTSEELIYYMQQYYRSIAVEGESREQLVVLSQVLKHPLTTYAASAYSNSIVEKVNGVVPRDFRHFAELFDDAAADVVKIEFEGVNIPPVILDRKRMQAVHAEICKRYGIAVDRHVEGGN